uniref:Uncharacterized protein n=1 Tax=Arundo donax TaxID=35708 RepID=A0A0A9ELG1_ARUDO
MVSFTVLSCFATLTIFSIQLYIWLFIRLHTGISYFLEKNRSYSHSACILSLLYLLACH